MNYKLNFGIWNKVFAIPRAIVDEHLKKVNLIEIKTLLWILSGVEENFNSEKIADSLKLNQDDVENALEYWRSSEIIFVEGYENNSISPKNNSEQSNIRTLKPNATYIRPNSFYIAERMKDSNEIHFLMQEAQTILGRPLSGSDSAVLLMLHDNDGLPVDVIIMLLQYAASVGKFNIKYIEKVGNAWANEGVDTHEKAEEKIMSLNKSNVIWKKFSNLIGIAYRAPTAKEEEAVVRWFDEWKFNDELIKEAYDRCVNNNGKYVPKYMDSIITKWRNQRVTDISQALAENLKRNKKYSLESTNTSYNIDEYENYNIFDEISD